MCLRASLSLRAWRQGFYCEIEISGVVQQSVYQVRGSCFSSRKSLDPTSLTNKALAPSRKHKPSQTYPYLGILSQRIHEGPKGLD